MTARQLNNKNLNQGSKNIQSLRKNIEDVISKHHKSANDENSHNFVGGDKSKMDQLNL